MDKCAACGAPVDGDATYCTVCSDRYGGATGSTEHDDTESFDTTRPTVRGVGLLLVGAVVLGGFRFLQSLEYISAALRLSTGADTVGFLLNRLVVLAVLVAFAVMAKRLFDGRADVDQYGRRLQTLAAASAIAGVLVTVTPGIVGTWLPTVFDPASVVLTAVLTETSPGVFRGDLGLFGVGFAGAAITFLAGWQLRRH